MCRVFSCIVGRGCLLWPVHFLNKNLLALDSRHEIYKKDLHNPDSHNGVITHLEPDILECEVKWAWGSITTNKASGGDEIPVELFQILKVLHSICQQIWKTQQWPRDWKRSVFIPIPKKDNAKKCYTDFQEAGQVVWYSHLFQNFPQFIVNHTVKGFGIVNKAEIYVFFFFWTLLLFQWSSRRWQFDFWFLCLF